MKVKICLDCFERCETGTDTGDFDAHSPTGTWSYPQREIEVSTCCEADFKEVDEDLVIWHEELVRAAKESGQEWMIDDDPERHYEGFNADLDIEEELAKAVDVWSST